MWGEKVKFACKVSRTENAQISGYPLLKDHCLKLSTLFLNISFTFIELQCSTIYHPSKQLKVDTTIVSTNLPWIEVVSLVSTKML